MEAKKPVQKTALEQEYSAIESEFKRDVAFLEARPVLERAGIVAWGMIDALLLLVFVLAVPVYLISGTFTDRAERARLAQNAANTHAIVLAQAPAPLDLGAAKALQGEAGYSDFLVDAENTNEEWYATFQYSFVYDGGETDLMTGFLNPGEVRPLVFLHVKTDGLARNPRVNIEELTWHRVDRHAIANTEEFLVTHADFPISDLVTASDIVLEKGAVARTDFTVENRTPYSYWEPEFLILLMRGGNPTAVSKATVSSFLSGEKRPVSIRWFQTVPAGATAKIIPAINYFDSTVYMNPVGE